MAPTLRERPILTPVMQRLLAAMANGRQLKEVAAESFISYSTATNTIHEAKKRLKARHIPQAVIRAHGLGYLSHPTGPDLTVFPTFPEQA